VLYTRSASARRNLATVGEISASVDLASTIGTMRFRRLGSSDLKVSEVGFGTWTLVTDWWGRTDDPHDMIRAALDAGINFIDTAPVYGADGAGETILAGYLGARDDLVLTTKVGYDIAAERKFPGQSERPHDWSPDSVRTQVDDSLRRLGTDRIDLLQLHNPRIEPILDDALWETLVSLVDAGKVRALGVALGPAIGWVEEGKRAIDERPITSLQTVFNVLEQEPGRTFARRPRVESGEIGLISRVPHASDTLSGKITPDTVFPPGDHRAHRNRDNMLDNFEKAATLSSLWTPETGRTMGQAAIAGILADNAFTCVLPTVLSVAEVREYAAASDLPLTSDEKRDLDSLWERNFDHEDRYVMPLKSSV
jgi:aryl-alcohol dehydrogenase-like predicted oxidoreductase